MKNRETLFDPIFSPKFFENNEINTEFKVDFPLPPSVEAMKDFLQGKDGEKFRAGMIALVERLQTWVRVNGMPEQEPACEDFKRIYSTFSGKDPDFNKIYFALFRQGLPHLAAICELLDSDKIPLDIKKDNVKNLIAGIKVCPPGASTNIADTYWKLASQLNLATELMATRRQIVQQIVLEALQEVKTKLKLPEDELVGMEIHYVNAIINQFASVLAVNTTEDEYENICNPGIILALLKEFLKALPGKLSVEAVIKKIAYERDYEDLIKSDLGFNKIQSFEQGLAHYGEDPNFSFHDIILMNEDGDSFKARWHVDYNMMLTLFNRFAQNGYLQLEENIQKTRLGNQGDVCYLPVNSLELASIIIEDKHKPFIPYCVELFAGENQESIIEMMDFLLIEFTEEHRFGIVQGIQKYMKYYAAQIEQDSVLKKWVGVIMDILPDSYKFDLVLKELPKAGQQLFLHRLGSDKLKKLIKNGTQLINVLGTLEQDQAYDFLNNLIGKDVYPKLVTAGKQLAAILSILPVPEWDACIASIGDKRKDIMQADKLDSNLIAILFSRLPVDRWDTFFLRHFASHWWQCITNMNQLIAILKVVPEERWKILFQHLDSDRIAEIIGQERLLLLFTFFHWRRLLTLLIALTTDQCKIILQHLGSHMLRTIIGGKFMSPLPEFLEELPEDKCKLLLDCFDKDRLIDDVMTPKLTLFSLPDMLNKLPENKCGFFLDYLGQDRVYKIMEAAPHLWTNILTHLPAKKCNLFFDRFAQARLDQIFFSLKRILYVMERLSLDKAELFINRFTMEKKQILSDTFICTIINMAFTRKFESLQPERSAKALAEIQQTDAEIHAELIPDMLTADKEAMVLDNLQLHREYISGWLFLRFLAERPAIFANPAFKKFDPEKLLTLFVDQAGLAVKIIPEDKCEALFAMVDAKLKPRLIESLRHHVQLKKSLAGFTKIAKQIGVEVMSAYSVEEMAALVKDKNDLIAALKFMPAAKCVALLDAINSKRLSEMLLENQTVKQQINSIEKYKPDSSLYDSLLLALLRARKQQYLQASEQPHHVISLFRPVPVNPSAQDLLEQSLIKSINEGNTIGLSFFNHAIRGNDQREMNEAVNGGYLKKFTRAYRANI